MKKTVLLYGMVGGVLIAALKLIEYRFLVLEHSLEIYGGIVALIFASVGIWLGLKLSRKEVVVREVQVPVVGPFARNEAKVEELGITPREMEILEAMAAGFSNKEIGAALGLSVKTVETYKSRAAEKLGLRSRVDIVRHAVRQGWLDTLPESKR